MVFVNTNAAAAAGVISALLTAHLLFGKADLCATKVASGLEIQTANNPQIPTTPCTEIAPTGYY
jgi:Amt family ammonium transporter